MFALSWLHSSVLHIVLSHGPWTEKIVLWVQKCTHQQHPYRLLGISAHLPFIVPHVPMDFYVRDLWSSTFWEKNFWYEVLWWVHTPSWRVFLEIKYMLYCVEKFISQSDDCMEKYGPSTVASLLWTCMLTVILPKVMPIEWLIWTFRILYCIS